MRSVWRLLIRDMIKYNFLKDFFLATCPENRLKSMRLLRKSVSHISDFRKKNWPSVPALKSSTACARGTHLTSISQLVTQCKGRNPGDLRRADMKETSKGVAYIEWMDFTDVCIQIHKMDIWTIKPKSLSVPIQEERCSIVREGKDRILNFYFVHVHFIWLL